MNDAQQHVAFAIGSLRKVVELLDDAAGAVKAQGLKDFDSRALSLARTNAEQALMWAERAAN